MFVYSNANQANIELPVEDYTFNAVLKKGRTVSSSKSLYVEAIDFGTQKFVFKMTLMDASIVSDSWPEFEADGLVGQWRLQSSGLLKLVQGHTSKNAKTVKEFLLDQSSHNIFRQYYKTI
jgi:hypothetical protein